MVVSAAAQESKKPRYRITENEVVVVSATTRKTLLISPSDIVQVIDRQRIEELQPASTGDLIAYATGAAVETGTGSGLPDRSIVALNGLPPSYTLVLVDGVPLVTEHVHTGQNLEFIPPQGIERIEILRGAASAQYGSDAVGGLTTRLADYAKLDAGVTLSIGDEYRFFSPWRICSARTSSTWTMSLPCSTASRSFVSASPTACHSTEIPRTPRPPRFGARVPRDSRRAPSAESALRGAR